MLRALEGAAPPGELGGKGTRSLILYILLFPGAPAQLHLAASPPPAKEAWAAGALTGAAFIRIADHPFRPLRRFHACASGPRHIRILALFTFPAPHRRRLEAVLFLRR